MDKHITLINPASFAIVLVHYIKACHLLFSPGVLIVPQYMRSRLDLSIAGKNGHNLVVLPAGNKHPIRGTVVQLFPGHIFLVHVLDTLERGVSDAVFSTSTHIPAVVLCFQVFRKLQRCEKVVSVDG